MKFLCKMLVAVVLLTSAFSMPCHAESKAYNWYCVHVKDHVQPSVGGDIAFVEELGGYYIDRNHTLQSDADKVIYLTFDAGYENGNVSKILDVLKKEKVSAAFFVLENLIKHDTALVRRMADEGHLVCNHTARHKDMSKFDDESFLGELRELERIYEEYTGKQMASYYRPPEGRFSRENLACAQKNGYRTIFWSFAYPDWDNEKQMAPDKAKAIILDNAHNGEVMLLHPTSSTNAEILGEVIRTLKSEGYRFGLLDELVGKDG